MPVLTEDQVQVAAIVSRGVAEEYTRVAQDRGLSRAAFLRELLLRGYRDYQREQDLLERLRPARTV